VVSAPLGRRGFALLATLWVLAVLAGLAVTVMAVARSERRATANAATEARARWALSAALAVLVDDLSGGSAELSAASLNRPGDSTVQALIVQLNHLEARVAVSDARSRVNLNLADSLQLQRLFEVAGLPADQALTRTAAVLDWRDADGVRRPRGAEAAEYAALRPPGAPRNGPFESAADLEEVLGLSEGLVAQLRPWVGTGGDGRINVNTAPAPVLATLPGVSLDGAHRLVARRREGAFRNVFELVGALPPEDANRIRRDLDHFRGRIAFSPRELELTITAAAGGAVVGRLRAVVRMGGGTTLEILRLHRLSTR